MARVTLTLVSVLLLILNAEKTTTAFAPQLRFHSRTTKVCGNERTQLLATASDNDVVVSRRSILETAFIATAGMVMGSGLGSSSASTIPRANAAERVPLDDSLYNILRVREATQQETRLIKSGKFKDVQRANVKLAVRFILENYRLSDSFVAASSYLDGNQRRADAGQIGQNAVQNLYTILEYFDAADVQNIKISTSGGIDGKGEDLVVKGLDATKKSIDDFLAYFPKASVDKVLAKIDEENELNVKEFDSSLGTIVNMPTTKN